MTENTHEVSEHAPAEVPSGHLGGDLSKLRPFSPVRLNLRTGVLTSADGTEVLPVFEPSDRGAGLEVLRMLTKTVRGQRRMVESKLIELRAEYETLSSRRRRYDNPLVKLISTPAPELDRRISDLKAEIATLEGWQSASSIHVTFEPAGIIGPAYAELIRAFEALRSCSATWSISSEKPDPGLRDQPLKGGRLPASLELRSGNAVEFDGKALRFATGDQSSVLIYPAMAMTVGGEGARDLFDLRHLRVDATPAHVAEVGVVPPDAEVLRNPPGDNMMRRADVSLHHDSRLPICVYGQLTFRGPGGIVGEYQFSNAVAAETFAAAFNHFREQAFGDDTPGDPVRH